MSILLNQNWNPNIQPLFESPEILFTHPMTYCPKNGATVCQNVCYRISAKETRLRRLDFSQEFSLKRNLRLSDVLCSKPQVFSETSIAEKLGSYQNYIIDVMLLQGIMAPPKHRSQTPCCHCFPHYQSTCSHLGFDIMSLYVW